MPPVQSVDRMAAALAGLTFDSQGVRVAGRPLTNRMRAVKAMKAAELALTVDNTPVKAAGLFRDAILQDPTYALPYEGLARSLMVKGDPEVVTAALKTALRLDPNLYSAQFLLGVAAQQHGDYAGAIGAWEALIAAQPDYPDLFARMAICAYYQGERKAAKHYLEQADRRQQKVPPQFRRLLEDGVQP